MIEGLPIRIPLQYSTDMFGRVIQQLLLTGWHETKMKIALTNYLFLKENT